MLKRLSIPLVFVIITVWGMYISYYQYPLQYALWPIWIVALFGILLVSILQYVMWAESHHAIHQYNKDIAVSLTPDFSVKEDQIPSALVSGTSGWKCIKHWAQYHQETNYGSVSTLYLYYIKAKAWYSWQHYHALLFMYKTIHQKNLVHDWWYILSISPQVSKRQQYVIALAWWLLGSWIISILWPTPKEMAIWYMIAVIIWCALWTYTYIYLYHTYYGQRKSWYIIDSHHPHPHIDSHIAIYDLRATKYKCKWYTEFYIDGKLWQVTIKYDFLKHNISDQVNTEWIKQHIIYQQELLKDLQLV